MEKNLFSILSVYRPTENSTPLENYSTELLVYLLNYSLANKTHLFSVFIGLLYEDAQDVEFEEYAAYSINTQQSFYITDEPTRRAYPDISIETKDKLILIEVKVESSLNYYDSREKGLDENDAVVGGSYCIDQIELYQKIKCNKKNEKDMFLLTKYVETLKDKHCPSFKKSFLWHNVGMKLSEYVQGNGYEVENFLITEVLKYMEDNKMTIPKVTYELASGMESLKSLFQQIEVVLGDANIPYKKTFGQVWLGYYLYKKCGDKKNKEIGWVGTYHSGRKLIFKYYGKAVCAIIEGNGESDLILSKNKSHYDAFFKFEERRYFCMNSKEQIDVLSKWITENYTKLAEYSE